jgi:hypothetical protein
MRMGFKCYEQVLAKLYFQVDPLSAIEIGEPE